MPDIVVMSKLQSAVLLLFDAKIFQLLDRQWRFLV
jgi:hypothetical protein